jgi:hypothetical protein
VTIMSNVKTPKQDRLREMREARFNRMQSQRDGRRDLKREIGKANARAARKARQ